jgi:hypothetical protein
LTAIALTVGVATFILISFALVLVSPTVATRLAEMMNLGPVFEWTWKILQWPCAKWRRRRGENPPSAEEVKTVLSSRT